MTRTRTVLAISVVVIAVSAVVALTDRYEQRITKCMAERNPTTNAQILAATRECYAASKP